MLATRIEDRPRDMGEPTRHFQALVAALKPLHDRVPFVPVSRDTFNVGGVELTLRVGDIAIEQADAIVSSANDELKMRSGTGEALRKAGETRSKKRRCAAGGSRSACASRRARGR